MVSYQELVKKTMPVEKRKSASRCIVGHYLVRPVSNIISIPLIEIGVDPTSVTIVSLVPIIIAFFVFTFSKTLTGFLIGWFLILLWNILDGVDGNIARYCDMTSKKGELWDATVGWIAVIVFYEGMGFAAYRFSVYVSEPEYYLYIGGLTAIFWLFPRLVMHKKTGMMSNEAANELKDLNHDGKKSLKDIFKLFFFNCISINGGAAVIFLIALVLSLMEICMIVYFFVNFIVFIGSLWTLLK